MPSSALGAGNQHSLVGWVGFVACENRLSEPGATKLPRVYVGVTCGSGALEGEEKVGSKCEERR